MAEYPELLPPMLRAGRAPLTGRGAALAFLTECLAEARAGRPVVVWLTGEPGIGKSRLLNEFPAAGAGEERAVLRGGASQAEGMPPYLPFLEALGEYIAIEPPDRLREQVGAGAAVLARLFPEIAVRLGGLPESLLLAPEQARLRLFEAVVDFLGAIARSGPLVLALDDLQWADQATCDLLVHLARRARTVPILIIAASREGEGEGNPALVAAREELNRQRVLLDLPLRPLTPPESAALAAELLRAPLDEAAGALLHEHSEGNPFFLEELLRFLVESRKLTRPGGVWMLAERPDSLLPPGVAGAIRRRLARLPDDAVEVLRAAAVVGRSIDPRLVAEVVGRDAESVEDALLAAARARVVRPEPDGGYSFAHDKLRETLLDDLSPGRRQRLHGAIARVLEIGTPAPSPRLIADLAFHAAAAADRERGVRYGLAAGQGALESYAATAAGEYFGSVAALLAGAPDDSRRGDAHLGLGDAAALAGDYARAVDAYRTALGVWERAGEQERAAEAAHRLGVAEWRRESVADAAAALTRALDLHGPGDSPAAAETLLTLADLTVTSLGRPAEGIAQAERALAIVERLGNRRLEARAACVAGNVKAQQSDPGRPGPARSGAPPGAGSRRTGAGGGSLRLPGQRRRLAGRYRRLVGGRVTPGRPRPADAGSPSPTGRLHLAGGAGAESRQLGAGRRPVAPAGRGEHPPDRPGMAGSFRPDHGRAGAPPRALGGRRATLPGGG